MLARSFLFLVVSLLAADSVIADADQGTAEIMTDTTLLIDLETADIDDWQIVNDGVMGGRSQGFVDIEDGVLRFTGDLVTRGGGFTSVRTFGPFDLSGYQGLALRVRGNGRPFEAEINDRQRYGPRPVSRRAAFATTEDWQTVHVPFATLRASSFGRPVDVPPLSLADVQRIGFYIVDGKDGPFRLEVASISAYR